MALSKIIRNSLNTGISDSSDATAVTITSAEAVGIGKSLTPNNYSGYQSLTIGGSDATTGSTVDLEDSSGNLEGRINGTNGIVYIEADPNGSTGSSKISLEVDGSAKMVIDANGVVSMPNQPLWSGIRAGTRMKTSNGFTMTNDQIIPFSDYENIGNCFASNIFTCPVAGKYLCTIYGIGYSSTSTWLALYTKLNGNVKATAYNDLNNTWQNISSSIILGASANDAIKFHILAGHADANWHEGSFGGATIHLIG